MFGPSNNLHREGPSKATTERKMHINYLDTFLAFLGMTFGGISAMPDLFFQRDETHSTPRTDSPGATTTSSL
jgi:hypothetical protein